MPFQIMFRLHGEVRLLAEADLIGITVLDGDNKITLMPHTFAQAMALGAKALAHETLKRKVSEIVAEGDAMSGGEPVWPEAEVFDAATEAPQPA